MAETVALLDVMEKQGCGAQADDFLRLSYDSRKWDKWMLKDTAASDRDRAVIAGHYVFATPECQEIKATAASVLRRKGIELEEYLKQQVKQSILRYLTNFRLVAA